MNTQKPWYLSKGVWGGIVAALAGLGSLFGLHIPEGEVQGIADAIISLLAAGGGLFAVYGRIVATDKVG